MIEVGVVVHQVEPPAQQGKWNLVLVVQTGHHRPHPQRLLDEMDLLGKHPVLQFVQEPEENRIGVGSGPPLESLLRTIIRKRRLIQFYAR